ncbi:MAG: bifunctional 5,10-methylene-tetrahydrofolate dehydrogenase/5,10-methylene-tetrahydrofolate cyclohydrolase [Candidatus Marinimicrobia bacterium]|nr:bifunctional 5,10-methylene-tetrahydrofolate dehydrogenase/5,10-methylene-tetrahydrofolate cyclohydrolase [Candidatus Neomarinimicrobiota bacterium]|tara:strand:- start:427 stop:1305 length:879 start_codon:yes stop_codon:yes gene_type:complete
MKQENKLLSGKEVSSSLARELSLTISELKKSDVIPKLAAIIIGENPASQIYVNAKAKFFAKNDCDSETFKFDSNISQNEILKFIEKLNKDESIHGILVQLPLPKYFDDEKILNAIDENKDVDGFHPYNVGRLFSGKPNFIPCTPHGIIKILDYYNIETSGKDCVVIGRSNIVGKPMVALLAQKFKKGNSTVTMCHSRTKNLKFYTRNADIVVSAIGVPNFLDVDMVKEGAVIIDVGINRVEDTTLKKGYRIVGDVNLDSMIDKISYITPVPGGVGPMTIAMLLYNTVMSAKS